MVRRLAIGYALVTGTYLVAAALGYAGREGVNDHPLRRSQVGPGWY